MNPVPNQPLTLLFNPFVYIAGAKALLLGLGAIVVAGLIGAVGHTHFDGVLDVHSGASAPLWFFLAEGIIDWLCLALVLLAIGKIASRTAFRTLDVLGTDLPRWPTVFISLIRLLLVFVRFGNYLMERILKPGANVEPPRHRRGHVLCSDPGHNSVHGLVRGAHVQGLQRRLQPARGEGYRDLHRRPAPS